MLARVNVLPTTSVEVAFGIQRTSSNGHEVVQAALVVPALPGLNDSVGQERT
jgi:hypothetical protein